jgi:hypothetical protein
MIRPSPQVDRAIVLVLVLCACAVVGCPNSNQPALEACPALRPEVDALDAEFASDDEMNGRARAFVQAAKDAGWEAARVEHLAAEACRRIGIDLGMKESSMLPRPGPGGSALGACDPVSARIDAVLRQGIRPWVIVQPGSCQPNMAAFQHCAGRCDAQRDPVCNASCRAHANINAACRQAEVTVRPAHGGQDAAALISTLEANLGALIEARTTRGERVFGDVVAVAQAGKSLSSQDGGPCVSNATEMASDAAIAIQLSMRASATIVSRVTNR